MPVGQGTGLGLATAFGVFSTARKWQSGSDGALMGHIANIRLNTIF
jgi:hypothetical protein